MQQNTSQDIPSLQNSINCNAIPLFPTMVLRYEVPEYQELLPIVDKLRNQDPNGRKASNMGGWHSPHQYIPDVIHKYIPWKDWDGVCWYMVNGYMQGNYSHTHPTNDWSGVLWLQVPEPDPAKLEFEHPDCHSQYNAITAFNHLSPELQQTYNYYKQINFDPVPGVMLMFPSSLRHRVHFSLNEEERIAMSFNISLPVRQEIPLS